MRPDEKSKNARLEREKGTAGFAKNLALTATTAGAASLGVGLSSKILPFLSEYIPADLAIKGISKVSPKLGSYLKQGRDMGLDVKEGLSFLKDKISPNEQKQQLPEQNQNILAQYSGELHQFVEDQINKGRAPLEAGALAQLDPKFKKAISQMEKDHKTPFSGILQALYGQGKQQNQQQAKQQAPQQQTQQQPGQGQAALMAILQKIQQSRGIQ